MGLTGAGGHLRAAAIELLGLYECPFFTGLIRLTKEPDHIVHVRCVGRQHRLYLVVAQTMHAGMHIGFQLIEHEVLKYLIDHHFIPIA